MLIPYTSMRQKNKHKHQIKVGQDMIKTTRKTVCGATQQISSIVHVSRHSPPAREQQLAAP